jgi:arylsulfatase A-like enzyme
MMKTTGSLFPSRRLYSVTAVSLLLFFIPLLLKHPAVEKTPVAAKPNVIIILTDDMGYSDVGCFGGNFVPTPNINRMAQQGLKCTQYYSAAPICSPSRTGLLTGMYPGRWNFSTYLDNHKHNKDAEQADFLAPSALRWRGSLKMQVTPQAILANGIWAVAAM